MLDQVTNLESDSDVVLPTASLDLSSRMRDLRARQGLKQSEVARRMRLDPSIPSLWEQGKRLPQPIANRFLSEIEAAPQYWRERINEGGAEVQVRNQAGDG